MNTKTFIDWNKFRCLHVSEISHKGRPPSLHYVAVEHVYATRKVLVELKANDRGGEPPDFSNRSEGLAANIDGEHFASRVFPSDVRINVRGLFTSLMTVGALKPWLLPALILQVSGQTRLLAEPAWTVRAGELLCYGTRGRVDFRPSNGRIEYPGT